LSEFLQFIFKLDLEIRSILLYGSVATGRARDDTEYLSDIDLFIISDKIGIDLLKRSKWVVNITKPVCSGIQALWRTSKEMEKYAESKYYLILDAFDEGKILYDPDNFLHNLREKIFTELKAKGVIKTDLYWQWPIKKFGDKIEY
ncbi:MAG TPA: nucleotidyltransferase domain-containing protein, partial [archaeon]|nr:nucleotidyltransferase domain-containing protein [archaeon]